MDGDSLLMIVAYSLCFLAGMTYSIWRNRENKKQPEFIEIKQDVTLPNYLLVSSPKMKKEAIDSLKEMMCMSAKSFVEINEEKTHEGLLIHARLRIKE